MNSLSHAALGVSLSQSFAKDKSKQGSVLVIGALAGMVYWMHAPHIAHNYSGRFLPHVLLRIRFRSLICCSRCRFAAYRKRVRYARFAFAYAVINLSLGIIQHQRAETAVFLSWHSNVAIRWNGCR